MTSAPLDWTALGFGLCGTFLGIVNTWRSFDRDKISLKVTPKWIFFQTGQQCLGIEIINLGFVEVTVNQVGFTIDDKTKLFTFIGNTTSGGHLPKRLEPRTSITVVGAPGIENRPEARRFRRAYAKTACDRMFTGKSDALNGVIKEAKAAMLQGKSK